MPIILVLFIFIPFCIGFAVEYLVCRFTMRKSWFWKLLPPFLAVVFALLVGVGRYLVWSSSSASPWPQLLFVPGLPILFGLLGLLLGWRFWACRWKPRVVKDKKRRGKG